MTTPPTTAYLDQTRVPQILAGTIAPTIIGTIFVAARVYTRSVISKAWGPDDSLILFSWILSIALATLGCTLTRYGSGRHAAFSSLEETMFALKLSYPSKLIYQLVLSTTKLGICAFYLRIFRDRTSRLLNYSIMGLIVAYTITLEFLIAFQCTPVAAFWNFLLVDAKCIDPSYSSYLNTVCNVVVDIFLIAFIVPRVLPLKIERRQKIVLLAIVSLGILVIIATVVRLVRYIALLSSKDVNYHVEDVTTWSSVEINTGLFCASAPCIRPLLRRLFPGFSVSGSDTMTGPRSVTFSKFSNKLFPSASHRILPDAHELTARDSAIFGKQNTTTNAYWGGSSEHVDADDNESQKAVLSRNKHKSEIKKTVSVLITDSSVTLPSQNGEASQGTDNFEHI